MGSESIRALALSQADSKINILARNVCLILKNLTHNQITITQSITIIKLQYPTIACVFRYQFMNGKNTDWWCVYYLDFVDYVLFSQNSLNAFSCLPKEQQLIMF